MSSVPKTPRAAHEKAARGKTGARSGSRGATQELRIIGGVFRSRRIRFPALEGLRPTGDRVRETLFNWLGQTMTGRSCLDLFAGSGALGLEALSRGASWVDAVDSQAAVVRHLRQSAEELGVAQIDGASYAAHHAEASAYLSRCKRTYDVVFLDPPFALDPWTALFHRLPAILKPGGLVYVEAGVLPEALHPPPPGWLMIRSARAGAVWFALFRCEYSQAGPASNETDNDDPSRLPRNV